MSISLLNISRASEGNFVGVPQKGYAITSGDSPKPIIFTSHVVGCLVVSFYDREKKIGILSHFDDCTKVPESMAKIRKNLNRLGSDFAKLEISIIGGIREWSVVYIQIKNELGNCSAIEKVFEKINPDSSKSDYNKFTDYTNKIIQGTSFTESEMKEYNRLADQFCYTQISLNTRNGVVSTTSEYQYLIHHSKNSAFPAKACKIADDLDENVQKFMKGPRTPKTEQIFLDSLVGELKKVYDSTKVI